jgi:hypothetical protein
LHRGKEGVCGRARSERDEEMDCEEDEPHPWCLQDLEEAVWQWRGIHGALGEKIRDGTHETVC